MWKSPRGTALNKSAVALGVLLFAASPAVAETPSVVCGTVTDATAGLLPGVAVSFERDGAPPLNAVTNSTGDYFFAAVAPGTYRAVFWQDGFKKTVRIGLLITPGFELRVDQRMAAASPPEIMVQWPAPPTVAYDRPTRTGSTFIKDIVTTVPTGRPAALRPCKIEKF